MTGRREIVLIVDDDEGVAALQRRRLMRAGFEVRSALTAADAMEQLRHGGIKLVVLDYRLSGDVNGLDFFAAMKKAGYDVPVIMVTGYSEESTIVEALRAGVRDFVSKSPTYLEYLVESVERLFEQSRVERALAEARAQLRAVVDSSLDAIISSDTRGIIAFFNPAAERMFGCTAADAVGQSLGKINAEMAALVRRAEADPAQNSGEMIAVPHQMVAARSGGERIPIEATLSACDVNGNPLYTFIARDIQSRIQAERELRKSQERFELAVWGSSDGLGDWNFKTGEAYWSPRLMEMLGYAGDEFEGNITDIVSRMHTDDRERVLAEVNEGARRREPVKSEFRLLTKSGDYRWFQGRARALYDERGRAYRFAGALTDISERKLMEEELVRREEQLRQSQKLEVIGSLAGGIAHEFNNLLQAIRGYTKYGMEGLDAGDQRYQDLDQVMKAADRATALTRQLLSFSRRQVLERTNCDPREIVTDLLKLLRPVIGEHIELEISVAPDASHVYADRSLLEQMLLNLCINARDAMPGGGCLRIKTDRVEFSEKYCTLHPTAKPGSYVVFSIADTGHGMTREVRERIFEPFFTTKEVGCGTGLGLAMVYGAVQQHDGLINVYSEVGLGTTFKIYLPIRHCDDAGEAFRNVSPVSGGKETILIAEDERVVRELAERVLSDAGYSVVVAADGDEAVCVFESHAESVSLALLDAVMPKRTGHEVFDRLRFLKPTLPIILCSGYDPEMGHVRSLTSKGIAMIQKPYDPDVLLRAVRDALDAHLALEAPLCHA